jgi:hypothetical protein
MDLLLSGIGQEILRQIMQGGMSNVCADTNRPHLPANEGGVNESHAAIS